jgi:hypothetical protein
MKIDQELDKEELNEEAQIYTIDLVELFFLSFISLPFFLKLSFDVLAYGPGIFSHFTDIMVIGVILGVDFVILDGLLKMRYYLKKGILNIDEKEQYATALVVGWFIMLLNFPILTGIVFFIANFLPHNLRDIFAMGGILVLFAIVIFLLIKLITFPKDDESKNEHQETNKNNG